MNPATLYTNEGRVLVYTTLARALDLSRPGDVVTLSPPPPSVDWEHYALGVLLLVMVGWLAWIVSP